MENLRILWFLKKSGTVCKKSANSGQLSLPSSPLVWWSISLEDFLSPRTLWRFCKALRPAAGFHVVKPLTAELFATVRDNGRNLDELRCVVGGADSFEAEFSLSRLFRYLESRAKAQVPKVNDGFLNTCRTQLLLVQVCLIAIYWCTMTTQVPGVRSGLFRWLPDEGPQQNTEQTRVRPR